MRKLKKNPNSSKRVRREGETKQVLSFMEHVWQYCRRLQEEEAKLRNCPYWSQLSRDLLHSILQRLSFSDLRRAKSVCSAWLSVSRQCAPRSQVPWLILFPEDNSNRCKLFNPEEKDKMYTSQVDVVGGSVCVATHGYWLLMRDPLVNLYIVNLLTGERINLPPPESQRGETKLERVGGGDKFRAKQLVVTDYIHGETIGFEIKFPRLWVDEDTKDYLVIFSLGPFCFSFYQNHYTLVCKRGDDTWRHVPECSPCSDMVYNHPKLYVYRYHSIQIFDFSSSSPEPHVYEASFSLSPFQKLTPTTIGGIKKTNIVVSVSGLVLMVVSVMESCKRKWSFGIYKKSSWRRVWDKVEYLGDEAMLLDLGITVPAKDIEGVDANCIYFSGDDDNDVFIFDIRTKKIHNGSLVCSSLYQYARARWFFPGFTRKINSL